MRANRHSELARYRAHVRELLADQLASWDDTMHPDFALTDQDAADIHTEIEKELREAPKPLLMVTVGTKPPQHDPDEYVPGYCLAMRFCFPNDVAHIEDLLIKQVRNRYVEWRDVKPKEIRRQLDFTVWFVPTNPTRGGWPIYDGSTGWWH